MIETNSGKPLESGARLPKDWGIRTIEEIATVSSGGTPDRGVAHYWNGGIPWITTSQIQFNTITEAEESITEAGLNGSAAKIFPEGTILMAMYGQGKTRGKVAILGFRASTNQACAAIVLNSGVVREYVFHYLSSKYETIRLLSNSGGQENLSGEIVKKIEVLVPPLPEQRAIAEALSDVDDLINGLDKLIAKKRAIKQATMQQLLTGKTRLPGFSGEWNRNKIGEFSKIGTGSRNTQDRSDDGRYPFFVRSNQVERIDSYSFDGEAVLTAGDGVGTGKVFHYINGRFDYHQRVYRISDFDDRMDGYFFYLYFSEHFYNRIMTMTAKSSVDSIRLDMIANMEVPVPSRNEQQEVASFIRILQEEIENLEQRKSKVSLLKQGMMQELLTGKTRLV